MELKNQNVLLFTRTMALGGTENVVLQLCEILKPEVNKIIVCSCGGINEEKLKKMNIKHIKINDIENKKPTKIIENIRILKKIIKDEKITIIHSHHRMAAMYANLVSNKKIIKLANGHNTFYDKKLLTKLAYHNTQVIAVGNQVKKNLVEHFRLNNKQVSVIHNAIKPFSEKIIIDKNIKKNKDKGNIVIGNIGRLSEQKGMEYFIEAASIVSKQYSNVKFYIVGSGEDEAKLRKLSKDLLPPNTIEFMGYRSDIQNLISQMDFIVLSSLWEGLPLTPIEAFSVGKTVVATSVDGTIEIVNDKENGFLVEPRNIEQLANAIIKLINNTKQREKFEKKAYETYINKFSFEKLKKKYRDFYKNILKDDKK